MSRRPTTGTSITGHGLWHPPTILTNEELCALLVLQHGNIAAVGQALGKHRMQVHRWLRYYELDIKDFRPR